VVVLSGENIVCITRRPWHSTWKTDQQIMSRLARTNRVLYVNPPRPLREAVRQALGVVSRVPVVSSPRENLHIYQEPILLAGWGRGHLFSRAYNRVAERLRIAHLRETTRRLGFHSPILWSYDPLASWAIGAFGEILFVYSVIDNYDEYFSTGEIWHTRVRASHRELMRRADVVFAVSEPLLQQCLEYNPNSFLAPNGVSFDLFEASMRSSDTPPDVVPIPRPIIGFIGVLHSSIDLGLLEEIAQHRPDWSLMIVGPVEGIAYGDRRVFQRLCSRVNVYYLGAKPPNVLPDYVKSCDVAIMPYRVNPLTFCGDSQKLYEYLACGKPVVSTPIPSVRRHLPLVEIAEYPGDFLARVERALRDGHRLHSERMAAARRNSWERRVCEMSEILLRRLRAATP